jgi:hypothetical protein
LKRYAIGTLFISLLGILITLAFMHTPVVAQENQAALQFAPSPLELMPGGQGKVNIFVQNVQNLYGIEFQLAFDPDLVEVIDVDPGKAGVQIWPADWWKDGFVALNQVDNMTGRIDFAATLLRPAQPVGGTRAIAVIPFAARKTGSGTLGIESAILSTRNAEVIPITRQARKIMVRPESQAQDLSASTRSAGLAPGRLALAVAAALALVTALGGFIYALRRR